MLELLLAAWLIFTLLEARFPARPSQGLVTRHTATDFACMAVNRLIMAPGATIIWTLLLLYVLQPYAPHHLIAHAIKSWPGVTQFAAGCFLLDLAQYLRHRFMHAFFWPFHATHHSAVEMRASVHWRLHPVDYALIAFIDPLFLYVLGFDTRAILVAQVFMAINNMWLHTNLDAGYGVLRQIFVSPNYHKWHHAKAREAVDKNFADLFVFLDVLGGTYYQPPHSPEYYGVCGIEPEAPLHRNYWGALVYPVQKAKELQAARREKQTS